MSDLQPVKDKVRAALTMAEASRISDNLGEIALELARLSSSGCSHAIALLRSRKDTPERVAIELRLVLSRLENNPELFG
jgi:hypothetical protein